jgi:hypothetical protein
VIYLNYEKIVITTEKRNFEYEVGKKINRITPPQGIIESTDIVESIHIDTENKIISISFKNLKKIVYPISSILFYEVYDKK